MTSSLSGPAASPSNATLLPRTTSWYSPPNTRGTWQLLVTCLITINLCVWTAVHLNIPAKIDKKRPLKERLWSNYYYRRIRWVLLGLLAPELVVYTAWMQWESARVFVKKVNRHNNKDNGNTRSIFAEDAETSDSPQGGNVKNIHMDDAETSNELQDEPGRHIPLMHSAVPDEPHEMTMTHGFYAGMGSYYIDVDLPDDLSWKPPRRAYLTANGLEYLIEKGGLSLPPKETIAERSKSDALAKSLVCLQAGYIIVQCISRLSSGLPLTFLEINTLGHVLCALIMYSFWFHKPQDLTLSIALESSFAKQLGNWYACCFDHYTNIELCDLYRTLFDRAKIARPSKVFGSQCPPLTSTQTTATALREQNVFEGFPQESDVAILGGDDCILLLQVYGDSDEVSKQIHRSDLLNMFTAVYYADYPDPVPKYILGNSRVRRHEISVYSLQIIERLFETKTEPLNYKPGLLEEETSNWPSTGPFSSHTFLPPLAIAISTALYGGLHAASWHSFFPTEVEKWFWRVSSIVIAASGLTFAYGMVSYRLYSNITLYDYEHPAKRVAGALGWVMDLLSLDGSDFKVWTVFGGIVHLSLGTCCVISRLYLVVESFISLRKVPVEVYQTPDWTQWIPHL
jgi:hypothetical protein